MPLATRIGKCQPKACLAARWYPRKARLIGLTQFPRDVETQTGTFCTGRKKRLENMLCVFQVQAGTIVDNVQIWTAALYGGA